MMVHDYMIIYARRNLYVNNTARLNFLILIYCCYSDPVKTSPLLWYVTLVDIAETTILVPYIYATSLKIWYPWILYRAVVISGFHLRIPDLTMGVFCGPYHYWNKVWNLSVGTFLPIFTRTRKCHENSPSIGHQVTCSIKERLYRCFSSYSLNHTHGRAFNAA